MKEKKHDHSIYIKSQWNDCIETRMLLYLSNEELLLLWNTTEVYHVDT